MKMLVNLASLALKCTTGLSDSTVNLLADRFSDTSQRMHKALESASERAWRTLEISLAGSSFVDRAKGLIQSREEQVLRGQIQTFLQSHVLAELDQQGPQFRQTCLKELQKARKAKLIPGHDWPLSEAAAEAERFARYTDPKRVVAAELDEVGSMADQLKQAGYPNLGRFVAIAPHPGPYPLLVIAVRYFFRRQIEDDERLSATWQFQQLEGITAAQEAGFKNLNDAIIQHGEKMERLLEDVLEVVTETRDDVRAIKEELQQLRELLALQRAAPAAPTPAAGPSPQQMIDLYQAVLQAVQGGGMPAAPPVSAPFSVPASAPAAVIAAPVIVPAAASPIAPAQDWNQVQTLLTRAQALPKQEQRQHSALFRVMGKLKAAAGDEQARNRLFPQLTAPKPAPIEVTPIVTPVADGLGDDAVGPEIAASSNKPPRLQRVQGRPLSALFQPAQDQAADKPENEASDAPRKPGKRLISKLFQPPK
jgi:hypothetical protein